MTREQFIQRLRELNWQQWFDANTLRDGAPLAGALEGLNFFDYGKGGLLAARLPIGRQLGATGVSMVETVPGKPQVRWVCECRQQRCLHAAALLLAVTDTKPETVMAPWDRWVDRIQTEPKPVVEKSADSSNEPRHLLLILRYEQGNPGALRVQPCWAKIGKRGGFAHPQAIDLLHPGGPRPAPPGGWSDLQIERLAALGLGAVDPHRVTYVSSAERGFLPIQSAHQVRALEALAQEWPVSFERASGPGLRLGNPRALQLQWHDEADGSQRLACKVQDAPQALIAEAGGLWYVDVARGEWGRLEADARIPEWVARAPTLMPEHVEQMDTRLQKLTRLNLPAPNPRRAVQHIDATPRPILRLRELSPYSRVRGRTIAVASLQFDYQGVRLAGSGPAAERRFIDGEVYEIQRNRGAELGALERLAELGLQACEEALDYYLLHEAALGVDDFVLPRGRQGIANPEQFQPLIPRLQNAGFELEYDAKYPAQVLEAPEHWLAEVDADAGGDWFNISLGIEINGERIDLMPVLRAAIADPEFPRHPGPREADNASYLAVLDDSRRIRLPLKRLRALLEPLLEWLDASQVGEGLRLKRAHSGVLDELGQASLIWRGAEPLQRQLAQLRERRVRVDPPDGFQAELRPYQRDGLDWLGFLAAAKLGGILADDMGLGKTVQVLAHVLAEKQAGRLADPALVVAPTSLVPNWRNEARRFAPDLRVLVLHGSGRDVHFERMAEHDLVITSYPLLPRDRELLIAQPFGLLILDEAQTIKNARTQAARVVRELNVPRRLAMTGTPLENHLGELWAQMDAVEPGVLGGERQFNRLYRNPIEKHQDSDRQQRLNRRIAPLMLRRRKQDVLFDLPPKTVILREVELEGRQRELYETLRLAQHERVREAIAERGLAQSGIVVLDALLKLRQVCCDPRLVKLEHARQVDGSAKLELLLDLLDNLVEEGRRVLVFSQFAEMLALIDKAVRERGHAPLMLTGQTKERAPLVERFQAGEVPIFLISLKAGGVGLNLTAADTVIHYDPWWNPAVENQATDRSHRIGQDKPVFVYKLLCSGTVEEKIQAMQARKADLAAAVLDGGSSTQVKFGEDDLAELFAPLM